MKENLEMFGGIAILAAFAAFIASAMIFIWTDSDLAAKALQTSCLFIVVVWVVFGMLKSFYEDSDADNYDQH